MKIPTKKQIILRISAIVTLVELTIMICFVTMPFDLEPYAEVFLDVFMLTVFSTPIIYIWVIKPYVDAHNDVLYRIRHMANHDPLTGLPNRRLLLEYLEKLLAGFVRHKLYGALFFIDLDGFKIINDRYGHDAGDAILIEVARRLKSLVRAEDIVSRIGGDEFVIALGQLDSDEQTAHNKALRVSEKIQNELVKPVHFNSNVLQVGASIGLCLLTPERTSVEAVLKHADKDMYRAKKTA